MAESVVEPTGSRELVRAISAEFDRRGWNDPDDLALAITTATARGGELDVSSASELAGEAFLERNGITRAALRKALGDVFADRVFEKQGRAGPTFIDQSVTIGDHNTISGSINAGGNQLALSQNTPPEQLLYALGDFVASAVSDGFSPRELELLDRLLAARQLDSDQLEAAARAGLQSADPEPGRLAKFRDAVLSSATSGLAVQAILAATGALL
jgi:hypothetical protein